MIASDLNKALKPFNSVLLENSTVEDSNRISFYEDMLFCFNGEIFLGTPFETNLVGSVEGKPLIKLLSKMGTSEIEISVGVNEMIIKKGRSKSKFAMDTDVDCPIDYEVDDEDWTALPENFSQGLASCVLTLGSDPSDIRTVCIHVSGDRMTSTDTYRMSVFDLSEEMADEFFIPKDVLQIFEKSQPTHYCFKDGYVLYKVQGAIVAHRNMAIPENYPDAMEIIKAQEDYSILEFPEKLYDGIQKAEIFVDKSADDFITISCGKGKLRLIGKSVSGEYTEAFKVGFKDAVTFNIKPQFMLTAIEKSSSISVNEATIKVEYPNCVSLIALTVPRDDDAE